MIKVRPLLHSARTYHFEQQFCFSNVEFSDDMGQVIMFGLFQNDPHAAARS